mgnify:CR=1 FL=1
MATTRKSTKSTAPVAEVEEVEELEAEVEETAAEPTTKQIINAGIARVVEELGVEAKNRYKVQRAIAFIGFPNAIEDGTFDDLIEATIADAGELPSGWELERTVAEKPVKAAPKAKAAPAKRAPAKATAAKAATPRKRPAR